MSLLYIFTAVLTVSVVGLAFCTKKRPKCNHTKSVVYAGILIALAFGLSYIKLFSLPQGGSISLAGCLPVMIYSYMFGTKKGVIVGAIFGILNFIQAPWFVHWAQFLLDYPIAFGAIGLSSIFFKTTSDKNKVLRFILGGIACVIIRYLCHVVSGIFVWGSADPNYGAVGWSFLYNSFVFADMLIALVAGCSLFASKKIVGLMQSASLKK